MDGQDLRAEDREKGHERSWWCRQSGYTVSDYPKMLVTRPLVASEGASEPSLGSLGPTTHSTAVVSEICRTFVVTYRSRWAHQ